MYSREKFVLVGLCLCLATPLAAQQLIFSTTESATVPVNLQIENGDLVLFDAVIAAGTKYFSADSAFQMNNPGFDTSNINALHVLDNGNLVLSTTESATLAGRPFTDEHLIEYNPVTDESFSFLDLSDMLSAAIPDIDIDAVFVQPNGNILFSLKHDGQLNLPTETIAFQNEDIIEFDPVLMHASIFLEGSTIFAGDANITGFSITTDGNYVVATEGEANIGGIATQRGDVVEYNPNTNTAVKVFDGANFGSERKDVDAVHAPASVPEPAGFSFLAMGAFAMIWLARRQRVEQGAYV